MRLAICVDPDAAASSGIYRKVLRSMDPQYASSQKEARIRAAKRNKFLGEMLHGEQIPANGIYPMLGERWDRPIEAQRAIRIPARSFQRLAEKMVRGIHFIESGGFIESPHVIDFYALTEAGALEVERLLEQHGREYARGPGILINRAVTQEDGVSAVVSIEVWRSFKMYASVTFEDMSSTSLS